MEGAWVAELIRSREPPWQHEHPFQTVTEQDISFCGEPLHSQVIAYSSYPAVAYSQDTLIGENSHLFTHPERITSLGFPK